MKHYSTSIVALLATSAVLNGVNGQFTGCSFNEIMKVQRLSSSMMGCVGLSIADLTYFAQDLAGEEMQKITRCVEDPLRYQEDCLDVAQLLAELGTNDSDSVPAIVAEHILSDPVGTCGCMSNLMTSSYREGIRDTCTVGTQMNNGLDSVEKLCEVVIQNDPWTAPKAIEGCSSTDAMRFNLLGLQYVECLNIEVNPDDVERLIEEIPDKTEALNTMMACLRDPKTNDIECLDIINRISDSVSRDNSLSASFLRSLMIDPVTVCECATGLGYSEIADAISDECNAKAMVDYLKAADESCAYIQVIEDKVAERIEGCDTSDLINSQLVGVQTVGCLSLESRDVLFSAENLDAEKMNQVADCLADVNTDNEACIAILDFFASSAAHDGTVAQHIAEQLQSNAENFCRCIHNVAYSVPASSIAETCVVDEWLSTVQASQSTCVQLGQVSPEEWKDFIKANERREEVEIALQSTADVAIELANYKNNRISAGGLRT